MVSEEYSLEAFESSTGKPGFVLRRKGVIVRVWWGEIGPSQTDVDRVIGQIEGCLKWASR